MKRIIYIIGISFFMISCSETTKTQPLGDVNLAGQIEYAEKINNKVVFERSQYKMILFALKSDQMMKPHSAPVDAPLLMLEGSAKITIGTSEHIVTTGDMITLPRDVKHGVYPTTNCKFLLLK